MMREQNGPPKLQDQGVPIGFGGLRALQGVSGDVHEGEIVAIIGPNGTGKTTLLNAISGIYHPARRSDSSSANCGSVTSAKPPGGSVGCPCMGNRARKASSVNSVSSSSQAAGTGVPGEGRYGRHGPFQVGRIRLASGIEVWCTSYGAPLKDKRESFATPIILPMPIGLRHQHRF
jgi:energy-coupling factor transporter ATP-binding protein EcfA2